jgi:cytochrome c-type biogenesis protein CcmF
VVLMPGQSAAIENYRLEYLGTETTQFSDRTEFRSTVEVYRNGRHLTTMHPMRTFHPSFEMASTLAAIRSTPVEDFYVVPSENLPDGSVGFRILVNPLMWWMWIAWPVFVLGTVIALWPQRSPERARAPAPSRVPAGASPGPALPN